MPGCLACDRVCSQKKGQSTSMSGGTPSGRRPGGMDSPVSTVSSTPSTRSQRWRSRSTPEKSRVHLMWERQPVGPPPGGAHFHVVRALSAIHQCVLGWHGAASSLAHPARSEGHRSAPAPSRSRASRQKLCLRGGGCCIRRLRHASAAPAPRALAAADTACGAQVRHLSIDGAPPPFPTVAPTRVPTVHSLPPSSSK